MREFSIPCVAFAMCLACAASTTACGSDSGASEPEPGGGASNAGASPSAGAGASAGGAQNSGGAFSSGGAGASAGASGGSTLSGSAGMGIAGASGNAGTAGTSAGGASAGPPSKRQTPKPIGAPNSAPNGYYEYLPPGYSGASATPLLVFWHGIGENGNGGSDLAKVLAHGPPGLIAKDQWDNARPFIVLSPQYVPTNGEIAPGGGCPSSAVIDAFISWAIADYEVDPKRVYLTGLSCGAIGSWDYLAEHQGSVLAAAVLLSGNPGDPMQAGSAWQRAGCALGSAAIWSLHGDKDPVVPYAPDHDTLSNLVACPEPPRRAANFTNIVNGGHDIWDPIYDLSGGSGDIYAWMLSNAKP
ncbi:MAG: PHB depolymerase family esterase [Pseudomonadota bacterium]